MGEKCRMKRNVVRTQKIKKQETERVGHPFECLRHRDMGEQGSRDPGTLFSKWE